MKQAKYFENVILEFVESQGANSARDPILNVLEKSESSDINEYCKSSRVYLCTF